MHRSGLVALLFAISCVSTSNPKLAPVTTLSRLDAISLAQFSKDGDAILVGVSGSQGCALRLTRLSDGAALAEQTVDACPASAQQLRDGTWLLTGNGPARWYGPDLSTLEMSTSAVSAVDRENLLELDTARLRWRKGPTTIDLPPTAGLPARLLRTGDGVIAAVRNEGGEQLVRFDTTGRETVLTAERLRRIESFDLSPDEKEIVFAADRIGNLDVGLVSSEGSEIRWVGPDPANERSVSWAPRGNKVTYVVETATGSLLRTVHVPTAYQVAIDLPFATARSISWEPKAERFAFVRDSLRDGSAIEIARYAGEERRTLTASRGGFGGEPDVLVGAGVRAIVFGPTRLQYGEKRPAVVWVGTDASARDAARYEYPGEIAHAVVIDGEPGAAFWDALLTLPWIDPARLFVVDTSGRGIEPPRRGVTRIGIADDATSPPPGFVGEVAWGDRDRAVVLNREDAARVVPFAASYLRSVLGDARANGSR